MGALTAHLRRHRDAYFMICLVLAALVPVLVVKLPPLIDVLGHIGRYSIQTGLDQHPWLAQYYTFEWRIIGNLGADILVELLHPFFGVETTVRLIVILNQALAATAVLLLSREAHGRITPFCVLALPLIYSVPFTYGFINFTLSMALALMAFVLWLRLTKLGRVRLRQYIFVPIGLTVWTCHTYGWAFLGLLCTASSLVRSYEAGRKWPAILWHTGLDCLPLLAPLLPMLLWRGQSAGGGTGDWSLAGKLLWLTWILRLDWKIFDQLCAGLLWVVVYVGLREKKISADRTLIVAAALCFAAFLILPLSVFGSYYADMRLTPYALMLALLSFDDRKLDARLRRYLTFAAVLFLAARLTATGVVYVERERVLKTHLEALDVIPQRARIATFVTLPCPTEWKLPWLSHTGSLAIARNHAFSNDQWSASGVNLLSVSFIQGGAFRTDPSQMIAPDRCKSHGVTMRKALANLPKNAFTHVWFFDTPWQEMQRLKESTLVWKSGDSAVFRLDRDPQQSPDDRDLGSNPGPIVPAVR